MDGPLLLLLLTAVVSIAYAVMPFVIFHRLKKIERILEGSLAEQQHLGNTLLHTIGYQRER